MSRRKVVVTGLGIVSPVGSTVESSWDNIKKGVSGVKPITSFDTTDFSTKICAPAASYSHEDYFTPKEIKRNAEFTLYGMAATDQAIKDAGLDLNNVDLDRFGVAVGSGIGGISVITDNYAAMLKGGPRRISPFFIPTSIINMVAGQISIRHGLRGPNISIVSACTTGVHNIGSAYRMIAYGDADIMVSGGAEMATVPVCIGGFSSLKALSKRNDEPEKASRPWDVNRDGFILGEGAGILILEEYEYAKARGAKIHAEVIGFGMSADAYHITSPGGDGGLRSMQNALKDANITATDIDYINAHGTSTPAGDIVEAKAVLELYGKDTDKITMSSTKSMTGHLLGAAGSVEAIYGILAMRDNIAPPTINLDSPDEEVKSINLVAHKAQEKTINTILSNSFGFGGTNGTLILQSI